MNSKTNPAGCPATGIPGAATTPKIAHAQDGFTIIEVLIAILLLGILVTAVLAPMTGLFGMSRNTSAQLATTTSAQNIMEQVKGLWRDPALYDRNCVKAVSFAGATVSVTNLTLAYTPIGTTFTPSNSANCDVAALSSPFTPVPAKRIVITVGSGASATVLQLDRDRPVP